MRQSVLTLHTQPKSTPDAIHRKGWYPFEQGATIGKPGSESGTTLQDEEHEFGARITLEQDGTIAPFSVTMGIYGTMFHTHFCGTLAAAESDYAGMKPMIEEIMLLWDADDRTAHYKMIDELIERYP